MVFIVHLLVQLYHQCAEIIHFQFRKIIQRKTDGFFKLLFRGCAQRFCNLLNGGCFHLTNHIFWRLLQRQLPLDFFKRKMIFVIRYLGRSTAAGKSHKVFLCLVIAVDLLQDMREAETAIGLYLEDYKDLFSQEIENFLDDLRMAVYDFEQEDEE